MRLEGDPLGNLGILRDGLRRGIYRLLEILYDKLHVLVSLREVDTDELQARKLALQQSDIQNPQER
jgi:hypothetical protein